MWLTESLLAEHWITWFTRFTLACRIDSSDTEWVLLLLHQSSQEVLKRGDTISHTNPFVSTALEELNDVRLNLCTTVMFRFCPLQEGRCFGHIFNSGLTRSPWGIWNKNSHLIHTVCYCQIKYTFCYFVGEMGKSGFLSNFNPTDWIFNQNLVCLFAWFARSSKILCQNTELILLSCGQSFYPVSTCVF